MTDIVDALYWDPFDVEIDANPYGVWQRLRDEAPLYRNDRYDFWALSRFADVEAASTAPKVFSSAHGTVLEIMSDQSLAAGQMIIFMDPPDHTRLRSLVSRAFTPRRMALLEDRVRDLAAGLLDPHVGSGSFDYVEDFAAILPSMVISSLLGVPDADRARVHHLIDTLFHIEPGVGMINDVSFGARIELFEYISGQLTDRSTTPRDDLLTDLVTAEVAEPDESVRRLTLEESSEFALLLISAGTETVARLLGWAAMLLDEHPDQRADLVADTSLIPNAVEELLRFEAPSPVQARWTLAETEHHGETLPAGSKVLLLTGSAGRDERKYPEAEKFDVRREFDHHVSFGFGIHFCLGASLARLEGRIALEETLKRHPEWTFLADDAVRLHTSTVR
ncbi:MAG: cytochrome P450, partial [Acidimicrobiales bacterium]